MTTKVDTALEQVAKALRKRKFNVRMAANAAEAKRIVLELIPKDAVVGIGDSTAVRQTGAIPALEERGNKMINPFKREITSDWELMKKTMRATFGTDVFLTGSNAVTLDGKLVSTDMVGNRAAGMIFAAPTVVLVVPRNKIVADTNAARERIKVCIAPYHSAGKGRKTPCVKTGKCSDCDSPERICNVTTILEHKPLITDITVILVDEDLGLSWDPSWPKERIDAIKERYHNVTWAIPVPESELTGKKS